MIGMRSVVASWVEGGRGRGRHQVAVCGRAGATTAQLRLHPQADRARDEIWPSRADAEDDASGRLGGAVCDTRCNPNVPTESLMDANLDDDGNDMECGDGNDMEYDDGNDMDYGDGNDMLIIDGACMGNDGDGVRAGAD